LSVEQADTVSHSSGQYCACPVHKQTSRYSILVRSISQQITDTYKNQIVATW